MGIRAWLRNWLTTPDHPHQGKLVPAPASGHEQLIDTDPQGATRFTIARAINGHLIQFSRYAPNPHGPDWKHDVYLVPEGQSLTEAVTVCMTLAELNK